MGNLKYIQRNTIESVAIITFDRPKYNVMNIAMMNEINTELESILIDNSLKCLVFNAKGSSWCAGVEVLEHKPGLVNSMITVFGKMFQLIHKLEIPTISVVQGVCLGGGMELAIACDIIIASENAVFGQPEIKLGFLPPYAAVRLSSLVGQARAIEICTTGRRYNADEALRIGIISHLVLGTSKEALNDKLNSILMEIKDCSPLIIRLNKRAIMANSNIQFEEKLEKTNNLFLNDLMNTNDVLEGLASFEQKRKASWLNS